MSSPPYRNSVLKALSPDTLQRLHLLPVHFEIRHELEFPGKPVTHLYFLEEGMASMTTTFKDGSQVEVGMFGYEAIVGVSALMGTRRSLNRIYTQIAGRGFSCTLQAGEHEFACNGEFHTLALRYVQAQLLLASQSAGCNAKHDVEQRLCRWLLLCADRAHTETFNMPHEFLSDMLGSSRPTVSSAAAVLKGLALIDYTRGLIHILDRAGLERKSCECYRVIRDHLENYLEFDPGEATPLQHHPAERADC